MKPFDLQKSLAGEPIICRNRLLKVLNIFYVHPIDCLCAFINHKNLGWERHYLYNKDGTLILSTYDRRTDFDLFMAQTKKKVWIGIEKNDNQTGIYCTTHASNHIDQIKKMVDENKYNIIQIEIDVEE
jgi:hypothetical protein